MLEINAQTIGFPSFDVLRDVHLTWNQSSNVLIIGANGSGKSTLLKYLLDFLLLHVVFARVHFKPLLKYLLDFLPKASSNKPFGRLLTIH